MSSALEAEKPWIGQRGPVVVAYQKSCPYACAPASAAIIGIGTGTLAPRWPAPLASGTVSAPPRPIHTSTPRTLAGTVSPLGLNARHPTALAGEFVQVISNAWLPTDGREVTDAAMRPSHAGDERP